MYNLFLDDIREPPIVGNYIYPVELRPQYRLEKWIIVRNYNEFVSYIMSNGLPIKVSFDHDLADEHYAPEEYWDDRYSEWELKGNFKEKTGYDCAKWLKQYCIDNNSELPLIFIHSANPVGANNIRFVFK